VPSNWRQPLVGIGLFNLAVGGAGGRGGNGYALASGVLGTLGVGGVMARSAGGNGQGTVRCVREPYAQRLASGFAWSSTKWVHAGFPPGQRIWRQTCSAAASVIDWQFRLRG
jgi:hypothetical protein